MALQLVGIGAAANDGTGDPARTAFNKLNTNLTEVFAGLMGVRFLGAADGSTDNRAAVVAALAAMTSGGTLYIPAGTYRFHQGAGSALADTIVANNITIMGDGPNTLIELRRADGTITNDPANETYSLFQATSRTGITIKNLKVTGYGTLLNCMSCTNVTAENITSNGLLANAGGYLVDKTLYFYKCNDVTVKGCKLYNAQFPVYLSGDSGTKCQDVKVIGNHFENNVAAGSFTSLFPSAVYTYYCNDVVVTNNTFRNIYSSFDNGTAGTGMGYGVYDGDGAGDSFTVTSNTFHYSGNGSKNATAIYSSYSRAAIIANNRVRGDLNGHLSYGIRTDTIGTGRNVIIQGNNLRNDETVAGSAGVGIQCNCTSTTNTAQIEILDNHIDGFSNNIRCDFGKLVDYHIRGNKCTGALTYGIYLLGATGASIKRPVISYNDIRNCQNAPINFDGYVVSPIVQNNKLVDGNLALGAGDAAPAIRLSTTVQGVVCQNNQCINTIAGAGGMLYVIDALDAANIRIFKDIISGNTGIGMDTNASKYGRFHTIVPVSAFWDINIMDTIYNTGMGGSSVPAWTCVLTLFMAITADASSAISSGTGLTVASTTGMATGDSLLLCKTNDPYNTDYYTAANWHATTVSSFTATTITMAAAIPAGDGTYVANTAYIKTAKFKAWAAVAA